MHLGHVNVMTSQSNVSCRSDRSSLKSAALLHQLPVLQAAFAEGRYSLHGSVHSLQGAFGDDSMLGQLDDNDPDMAGDDDEEDDEEALQDSVGDELTQALAKFNL